MSETGQQNVPLHSVLRDQTLSLPSLKVIPFFLLNYTTKCQSKSINETSQRIVLTKDCPFVDHYLQPLVHKIPSFVKDTYDFLNKLVTIGKLPSNSLLVTLDVSSLYANILHN